jgi:hypothetical protein
MAIHECEVYLLVDSDGNYVTATSQDCLSETYDNDIGSDSGLGRRVVKLIVKVPVQEEVSLTGDVPEEGEASLSIAS